MNAFGQPPEQVPVPSDTRAQSPTGFFRESFLWRVCLPIFALILVINAGLARFGPKDHSAPDVHAPSSIATGVGPQSTPSAPLADITTSIANQSSPSLPAGMPPAMSVTPTSLAASSPTATLATVPIRQRVADTEAALRSGEITTTINYANGNMTSVRTRFDLGDGRTPARLQSVSTYQSALGNQTIERITVGERTWQRQGSGPWMETGGGEDVTEQVRGLLPNLDMAAEVHTVLRGGEAELGWVDTGRGAEMTLEADATTGRPQQLQATVTETGVGVTWRYDGWNTAVAIIAPSPG